MTCLSRYCGFCYAIVLIVTLLAKLGFAQVPAANRPAAPIPTDSEAPTPSEGTVAAKSLAEQRTQVEANEDLEPETKNAILEFIRKSEQHLGRTVELQRMTQRSVADAEKAKANAAATESRLGEWQQAQPQGPQGRTLGELEQERIDRDLSLKQLKEELSKVESEIADRPKTRQDHRRRIATIEQTVASLTSDGAAEVPTGEIPQVTEARLVEIRTHRDALTAELEFLTAELARFDSEEVAGLKPLERNKAVRQIELATTELQLVEQAVKNARMAEAQKDVKKAQDAASNVHPALQSIAEYNQTLAERNQNLAKAIQQIQKERDSTEQALEDLRQKFESTKAKVNSVDRNGVGLPAAVGTMLRRQRVTLPNNRQCRVRMRDRQNLTDEMQLLFLDLTDEFKALRSPDEEAQTAIADAARKGLITSEEDLAEEARELFSQRRDYLESLINTVNKYVDFLTEVAVGDEQIVTQTREFANYIDERVLWVRSCPPITVGLEFQPQDFQPLGPKAWLSAASALISEARSRPVFYGFSAIGFWVLLFAVIPLGRLLSRIGQRASRSSFTEFYPTLTSLLITFLLSIPVPFLLAFIGWRLVSLRGSASPAALGLGTGLVALAVTLWPLEFLRRVFQNDGLAEKHFDWPPTAIRTLRTGLFWLTCLVPFLVFVVATIRSAGEPDVRNPIPRLVFFLVACIFTVFVGRVMHPQGNILKPYLSLHADGWVSRLRYVWYSFIVAAPLGLMVLVGFGYEYTGRQLAMRAYVSFLMLAFLLVVYSLVARLILVQRRKLRMEQARQRHAAAKAKRKAEAEEGIQEATISDQPIVETEEDMAVDLQSQTLQTRRFVATLLVGAAFVGLWLTWSDVLPALGFLEKWPVWTSTTTVSTTDDGGTVVGTLVVPDPVTIAELGLGILIGIVTFVAARNLPGLLEIAILQRLPLDRSVRYAITTLGSYLIIMLGMIAAFKTIGLRWSQIQWMATALTFGLAFGLQEMFANFIAGIIILFERPIRVGDIVTVDDVTGVVSRVRMRATTITNWDRKDYIVPNKDFITGRVLNWTLSDQVNRIVINVGIAYGSDKDKARELMLRAAHSHDVVVKDPEPQAIFEGFGDSALLFTLRCYIAMQNMPHRLELTDYLHNKIDDLFREANIEIAFPQQDIYVRSLPNEMLASPQPKA